MLALVPFFAIAGALVAEAMRPDGPPPGHDERWVALREVAEKAAAEVPQ